MDVQQKSTRAFFMTFTLLMAIGAHYFQHNQGGSGLELAQNNVVWIFFSILIGLGLWKITEQKTIIYSRFTIIFLIAVVLFFIPLFYPNNELANQSYTRLLGLLAGFLFYVSLQQFQFNKAQLQRLLLLIVLAGFIESCYSLAQDYLFTANNILGYNINYGRPYGIFQQPNVLASFMATTMILSGYLLQQFNNKKIQVFLLLSILLNVWVITITMSRTGYLGSLIAIFLFIPFAWKNNKNKTTIFLFTIFLGFGAALLSSYIEKTDILASHKIENIKEGGRRIEIYKNSILMVKDKPLLGYGYGSFYKNYLTFQAERFKNNEIPRPKPTDLTHPHNETLYWAIEGGIIPVLAILLLVFGFLNLFRGSKISHSCALTALVLPIALHTQTEYPLYQSALHWLVLLFLVFYVSSQIEVNKKKEFKLTFALHTFAITIPLATSLFMVTNIYTIYKMTKFERNLPPDINLLLDIVNPIVFENKLNFHLNYYRLLAAEQLHKPEEARKIITWTEEILKNKPHSYFYVILYRAYINNNEVEKANKLLSYARYLYPADYVLANVDKPHRESEAESVTITDAPAAIKSRNSQ